MFRFELFGGGFSIFSFIRITPILASEEWSGFVRQSGTERQYVFFWGSVSAAYRVIQASLHARDAARTRARNPHFYWRGRRRGGRTGAPVRRQAFSLSSGTSQGGRDLRSLAFPERVSNCGGRGDEINPNPSGSWPSTRPGRCSALLCSAPLSGCLQKRRGYDSYESWHY